MLTDFDHAQVRHLLAALNQTGATRFEVCEGVTEAGETYVVFDCPERWHDPSVILIQTRLDGPGWEAISPLFGDQRMAIGLTVGSCVAALIIPQSPCGEQDQAA